MCMQEWGRVCGVVVVVVVVVVRGLKTPHLGQFAVHSRCN